MTNHLACPQLQREPSGRFRRGTILIVALVTLLVVTLLAGTILQSYLQAYRQLRADEHRLQAEWLADSALARAAARLRQDASYQGETWQADMAADGESALAKGSAVITVAAIPTQPDLLRLEVQARYPDEAPLPAAAHRTLDLRQPSDK